MQPTLRRMPRLSADDIERFWKYVDKTHGTTGRLSCWYWIGAESCGYGQFGYAGESFHASRVAWLLATGEDPGDNVIRHRCDIRACVRFEHLLAGTQSDNMRDVTEYNNAGIFNPQIACGPPELKFKRCLYVDRGDIAILNNGGIVTSVIVGYQRYLELLYAYNNLKVLDDFERRTEENIADFERTYEGLHRDR